MQDQFLASRPLWPTLLRSSVIRAGLTPVDGSWLGAVIFDPTAATSRTRAVGEAGIRAVAWAPPAVGEVESQLEAGAHRLDGLR